MLLPLLKKSLLTRAAASLVPFLNAGPSVRESGGRDPRRASTGGFPTLTAAAMLACSAGAVVPARADIFPPDSTKVPVPPQSSTGVFAASSPVDHVTGLQQGILAYYHLSTTPDVYRAQTEVSGYRGSEYDMLKLVINSQRTFLAVNSGGKIDMNYSILDVIATPQSPGVPWTNGGSAAPTLVGSLINFNDYQYVTAIVPANIGSAVISPGPGQAALNGGLNYVADWAIASPVLRHELGHNFSLNHNHSYSDASIPASAAYTYDFTTGQYVTASPSGNGALNPLASPAIGVNQLDYGNSLSVMGNNYGGYHYSPREKQKLGWLGAVNIGDIGIINAVSPATGTLTNTIKLYDATQLQAVTQGTGANIRYGVQTGYSNVNYDLTFKRMAQKFVPTSATAGNWVSYVQSVDLYYVPLTAGGYGIAYNIDGIYVGTLKPGQTIEDSSIAQYVYINPTTGLQINAQAAPLNPDRYRSTSYTLGYGSGADTSDTIGNYVNLQVTTHAGVTPGGYRWDAVSGTAGAQDGSGTWSASGGNFRDILPGTDNKAWVNDGTKDVVFGTGSGTGGTVTVGGSVAANGLTFVSNGSGNYTLTGGTVSVGSLGIIAEQTATINSGVTLAAQQVWQVSTGATLTVGGAITNAGTNALYKIGQGDLVLSGANTLAGSLFLAEGRIVQMAGQSLAANADLGLHDNTTYKIVSGTLSFANSSVDVVRLQTQDGDVMYGDNGSVLQLASTGSTAAAPDLALNNTQIDPNIRLDAGTHYIGGSVTTTGTSTFNGDITGAGGLAYHDGNSASKLILTGKNSFTGAIVIEKGLLVLGDADTGNYNNTGSGTPTLSGNNVLGFNVASGDTAGFLTGNVNRNIRNLSSSGAGSAVVQNGSAAGNATLTVQEDVSTTYSGTIIDGSTGSLALNKTGSQTLTLTGDNTYSGGTTVNAGAVKVTGSTNLGTGSLRLAGGNLVVEQGQGLLLNKTSGASLYTGAISGGMQTGDFSALHTSTATSGLTNKTFSYQGQIFLTAGQWSFGEAFDDAAYLRINGTQILNNTQWYSAGYGTLNIASSGWYDIDMRVWSDGGGPIANATWDNFKGIGIKQGAQTASGTDYTAFDLGVLGTQLRNVATMVIANDVDLVASATITVSDAVVAGAEVNFTGAFTGSGNLTKAGAGTMILGGAADTYSGTTFVTAGTLAAGAVNAFSPDSAMVLSNASGVALNLRGFNQTVASLSGGGSSGGNVLLGSATLTTGADNTSTTFAGVVSGTGGLTKTGSGTMTLSGRNTYTGTTKITGGGVLNLDYSAGASNSGIVDSGSALVLDNGILRVTGRSGATITQSFSSLEFRDGVNGVNLVRNGATSLDVNVGAITRAGGGTIDFSGLTGAAVGARVSTTSGGNGALLDGGAQWATVNGADWASKDASNTYVVAYSGYVNAPTNNGAIPNTAAANVRITEGGAGTNTLAGATTTSVASLLMSAGTTASAVNMTGKTLSAPGIAVASGAKSLTLGTAPNAGTLTSSTNALQLISNNAAVANGLVVNAVVANNGATSLNVAVSGGVNGGTTVFAGTNTYTGTTAVSNDGTLQIGAGGTTGTLGSGAVTVQSGSTLGFNRSDAITVANTVGGAGNLTQSGAGTTTLTGANTYSGATAVTAGRLTVGSGTSGTLGSGAVSVGASGTLAFNRSDALTVSGSVSGTGALLQTGAGVTTLAADNTFSGTATISAGTLQLGNGGATGSLANATIVDNGTLAVNRSDVLTLANAVTGSGGFAQNGAGATVLTGANSYSGTTVINAGSLFVGNGGTSGTLGSGAVTNNGALVFARADNTTAGNVISGSGIVSQQGAGLLTLTGNNTYTGGTSVNGTTLQVGNGGTSGSLGTGVVDIRNFGTVTYNRSDSFTTSNVFTGLGDLAFSGTGVMTVSADSTRIGDTFVNSGTLRVGAGGTTGSLGSGTVINNGALIFNRSDAYTVSTSLAGSGTLAFAGGGGATIITGNGLFTGTTTIAAGQTVTFGDGGVSAGGLGGAVVNNGAMVISNGGGTVPAANAIRSEFFGPISGSGTITVNAGSLLLESTGNTFSGATTVNNGYLLVGSGGINGSTGTGGITLNNGTIGWTGNSSTSYVASNAFTANGAAFQTLGYFGSVTLTGNIAVQSGGASFLTSLTNQLYLKGVVSGSGAITVGNALPIYGGYYGATLTSFDNAANTYSGTLTALESNGGTTNSHAVGVLRIGNANALQFATLNLAPSVAANTDVNQVAFASGVTSFKLAGLSGNDWGGMILKNGSSAVALTLNQTANTVFSGVLSGTGSVTKTGTGSLTLGGANTYTGGTTLSGGWIRVANTDAALGAGTLTVTGNALLATASGGGARNLANSVFLASGTTLSLDGGYAALTLSGNVSGAGNLATNSSGTVTLAGSNTYTGTTTVTSTGTLQIGAGGTSGSPGTGAVVDNGALVFNRSDAVTVANAISGAGSLTHAGTGALTLTGANTYAGGTAITQARLNAGTASLGSGAITVGAAADYGASYASGGSPFLNITDAGTATLSNAIVLTNPASTGYYALQKAGTGSSLTLSGVISGGGANTVLQLDTATGGDSTTSFTLSGNNTFDGQLRLNRGTLTLANANAAGNAAVWIQTNANANGNLIFSDSFTLNNAVTLGTANNTISTGANNVVLGGVLTSAVAWQKVNGAGTLTLAANNAITGAVTIGAGTLQLGNGGTTGSLGGTANVVNNGVLAFNRSDALTVANVVSGSGAVSQNGSGTTTLTGANTYAGVTTVNAGTLVAGSASAFGTGAVTVNAGTLDLGSNAIAAGVVTLGSGTIQNGTLTGTSYATTSGTISAVLAGTGALTQSGAGTTTLIGNNTYSGGTTISQGRLNAAAASLGSGAITVGAGSAYGASYASGGSPFLNITDTGNATLSNAIALTNPASTGYFALQKAGAGSSLTLSGVISGGGANTVLQLDTATGGDSTTNFTLSGNNTFAGQVRLNRGTLTLANANAAGTASLLIDSNSNANGNLIFSNGFTLNNAVTIATSNNTISTLTNNVTLAGVVSGSVNWGKTGTGALTLSGANTYSGVTSVNAGTLIAGSNTAFGAGAVTVYSGGTANLGGRTLANAFTVNSGGFLAGAGTVSGAVAFASGGRLSPGTSGTAAIQTFAGGVTLASGAIYAWDILGSSPSVAGADFDKIVISAGTLSVNSGAILRITASSIDYAGAFWDSSHAFTVAGKSGTGTITGAFGSVDTTSAGAFSSQGAWSVLTSGAGELQALWTPGSPLDSLEAIPEPSTYGLMGAGALAAAAIVRRRKRKIAA